jgi:excisionase family DNA binding protein
VSDSPSPVLSDNPSRLLSRGEVAALLNVSTKTVDRWSQLGLLPLPAIKKGRRVRWLAADLEAHRESIRTTA